MESTSSSQDAVQFMYCAGCREKIAAMASTSYAGTEKVIP